MLLLILYACGSAVGSPSMAEGPTFTGRCDASAFVPVGADHILVADDEKKSLGLYPITGGEPVKVKVKDHVGVDDETDLEGAAMIGNVAYFIGSHGRTAKANEAPARQYLFALEPSLAEPRFVGGPFHGLHGGLFALPEVGEALRAASKRAPKNLEGGLNIEGLAATPTGELLMGFRNPLIEGRALVVTLKNPSEVLKGRPATLSAETVDLGGRGIRSMESYGDGYLVIAGPVDSESDFAVFRWDRETAVQIPVELGTLNPEAIGVVGGQILVLSDDGRRPVGGVDCKDASSSAQSFRSMWLKL